MTGCIPPVECHQNGSLDAREIDPERRTRLRCSAFLGRHASLSTGERQYGTDHKVSPQRRAKRPEIRTRTPQLPIPRLAARLEIVAAAMLTPPPVTWLAPQSCQAFPKTIACSRG